ncbi:ABC transporter ATP-binding protein [Thermodesulforhabdus norvegica]|uniref:Amino acid/amide ABC transporter ATP-binding protein 1, HAAT family n=1 Tax=Thermodesulforhabdus norvegica TaxID=39841 RepID=A0A1I4VRK6_9BACT|nr:ABC transporter ATP-binding protein [Thermodesulforhabdus norvegica]SFN03820.1 amino acid/amide ABC transporter ATP-binding protein 1, HAAT family [Thermodesulforhabdus norvegica]
MIKRQQEQSTILKLEGVSRNFGGLQALTEVSYRVPEGIIQAVIGPNGAGKTTLFNCISGLIPVTSGRIFFRDTRIDNLPAHRIASLGISRTFQHVALFKNMTVLENVMVGRHVKSHSGFMACGFRLPFMRREERDIRDRAYEFLKFVGLEPEARKPAGSLPLGKQKILEIARALATEPTLLLLDEPAGGLNAAETEELGELIKRIKNLGITVMIVEHDMNLVMEYSDRILVLHFGHVLAEGTPSEVKNDEKVIEVYLGTTEAC